MGAGGKMTQTLFQIAWPLAAFAALVLTGGLMARNGPGLHLLSELSAISIFVLLCGAATSTALMIPMLADPSSLPAIAATAAGYIAALSACMATVLMVRKRAEALQDTGTVLTIERRDGNSVVSLRVKENTEEWPPLKLELGFNLLSVHADQAHKMLLAKAEKIAGEKIDPEHMEILRETLRSHGATHPMDISGAGRSRAILELFESILLGRPPETSVGLPKPQRP